MTRRRRRRRGRPRRAQHLPHPREGGREGLFGHRPAAEARRRHPPMIAVAGCVAQAEGAEIPRRAPGVDIVVGPQAYHNLPELVARGGARASARSTPTCRSLSKFGALPARRRQGPSAFLTVQEGCDKFCTYCVVPYTRGAEVSRPCAAILDEAQGAGRRAARGRSPCSARTSTPGRRRREGPRPGPRRADPRARRAARPGADPLHDQPSQRHDRGPDPRPCRGATS